MKPNLKVLPLVAAGCLLIGTVLAQSGTDHDTPEAPKPEHRRLAKLDPDESPFRVPAKTISPQKAQELALAAYHGKEFNKVEMEKEDGRVIYSMEFSDETEVVLDAATGKVIEIEKPDHEKD